MVQMDRIAAAAEGLLAAAYQAEGLEQALADFARAADARDAVLMRNSPDRLIAAFATDSAAEAVADFAAGRAPPSSRYTRVKSGISTGFRVDHDDYSDDDLAADPFYQEFLRPAGVFWHANVVLGGSAGECLELSLKRQIALGPYQRSEVAILDQVLPSLRAAARIAKATLDARAQGMSFLLEQRSRQVIALDAEGRALPGQDAEIADGAGPVRLLRRRLLAAFPQEQARLDRVVARATKAPGQIGVVSLTAPDGQTHLLQVHPVPGGLRDILLSASAIAVLIPRAGPDARPEALVAGLGLTTREAEVAALLATGLDLSAIGTRLKLRPQSVRSYLKTIFDKTGTRRQAELVALLARMLG